MHNIYLGGDNVDYNILLERISALAAEREISASKAYVESGVGKNFAYNIKVGQVPSVEKIQLLADYFSVTTDYLLGNTNIKKELPTADTERVQVFADALLKSGALPDLSDESPQKLVDFINASGGLYKMFNNKE